VCPRTCPDPSCALRQRRLGGEALRTSSPSPVLYELAKPAPRDFFIVLTICTDSPRSGLWGLRLPPGISAELCPEQGHGRDLPLRILTFATATLRTIRKGRESMKQRRHAGFWSAECYPLPFTYHRPDSPNGNADGGRISPQAHPRPVAHGSQRFAKAGGGPRTMERKWQRSWLCDPAAP
jgi:hypothetical protein